MRRYVFDYPPSWKVETVGKVNNLQRQRIWMAHQHSVYCLVRSTGCDKALAMQNEKGMQGIDCRVRNKIKGWIFWHACKKLLVAKKCICLWIASTGTRLCSSLPTNL